MRPSSGSVGVVGCENICCISQVFRFIASHVIERMSPMSPIRLYIIACKAAVLALARACHQLISKNDMIPTPSQPMNSCSILLAVVNISMAIRNNSRYFENLLWLGSVAIYQFVNSRIDQVMSRATVKNVTA